MIRMLQKNPDNRITAKQALEDVFFQDGTQKDVNVQM